MPDGTTSVSLKRETDIVVFVTYRRKKTAVGDGEYIATKGERIFRKIIKEINGDEVKKV